MATENFTVTVTDYDGNDIRTEIYNDRNYALGRAKYISETETFNGLPTSTTVSYGPPYTDDNDRPIAEFPTSPFPF